MEKENLAYLCGFLCSKGALIDGYKNNYLIRVETKNEEMVSIIKAKIKSLFDKEPKSKKILKKSEKSGFWTTIISLHGKNLIKNFLGENEVCFGEKKWKVPRKAYEDPLFRRNFLRGFFDGGSYIRLRIRIHKTGKKQKCRSIRLPSVNQKSLYEIKSLLSMEGITCSIYPSAKHFILDIDGKNNLKIFMEKIGFEIKSKADKASMALSPTYFDETFK